MARYTFYLISCFLFGSQLAAEHSVETVGAVYQDKDRSSQIFGIRGEYLTKPRRNSFIKRPLTLGVNYIRKDLEFKDPNSFVVRDQLKGQTAITQNDLSLSFSLNLDLYTDISTFYSLSKSPLTTAHTYGLAFSRWVREETLKLQFSISSTTSQQIAVEIYDTTQRRVRLPSDLEGKNFSTSFTHYTSPLLITTGSISYTQRTDRPDAHAQTLGIRRFIPLTHSAVHLSAGHYTNIGQLQDNSLYGEVKAYSLKGEWHQKIKGSILAIAGYRFYQEEIAARHNLEQDEQLASDTIYAMLKYRFGHRRWIETAHEVSTFIEQYSTNEPRNAMLVGIGLVIQLP